MSDYELETALHWIIHILYLPQMPMTYGQHRKLCETWNELDDERHARRKRKAQAPVYLFNIC